MAVNIQFQDEDFLVVNLYAPNKDSPQFFLQMMEETMELGEKRIYIGDFNVTLEPEIDRKGIQCNNQKSCEVLKRVCKDMSMVDVWQIRNEGVRRYSYFRNNPYKSASRIDFALVPQGVDAFITSCFYTPNALSDHSAFFISLAFIKKQWGKGNWKFNDSLIERPEFVQKMNDFLDNRLKEYSEMEPAAKWELIKFECTNFSQDWSRQLASEKKLILAQLYEKLQEMEENLSKENSIVTEERLHNLLSWTKEDIKDLEFEKTLGILFRCKAKMATGS